jgi:MacB-like periplasmic core domain
MANGHLKSWTKDFRGLTYVAFDMVLGHLTMVYLSMIWNDIRYTLRLMRRSPGFTTVGVLSLELGIGANTAIFSLFYTIVLRTLPVAHPEQLVEFLENRPNQPRSSSYWEWESYELFRDHNHVFSALTGMSFDNLAQVRIEGSETETLIEESVLRNYFRVLGLTPAIGRFFGPEDVPASGIGNVVVISWSYWNSRFNRNPAILGKRIFVGDESETIIGVAPHAYTGPRVGSRTDIWAPQEHSHLNARALDAKCTLAQAQAEMAVLYQLVLEQRAFRSKHARIWQAQVQVEPAAAAWCFGLREPPFPTMYFNLFQENRLMNQFQLRTTLNPASVAGTVRRIVRDLLKTVPVTRITTLADQVDANIVPERLIATLSEFFGALGAALAGMGLYGLLAYTVARRTNEVGIRMALGATASDVSTLVLRDALGMMCGGLIAGVLLVFLSRPLVVSLVQDLKPDSIPVLVFGDCAIIGVALLASYIPVRRAVRVDPMVALRHD